MELTRVFPIKVNQLIVKSQSVPSIIFPRNSLCSEKLAYTTRRRIPVLKKVSKKTHSEISIISLDSVFLPIFTIILIVKVLKT